VGGFCFRYLGLGYCWGCVVFVVSGMLDVLGFVLWSLVR